MSALPATIADVLAIAPELASADEALLSAMIAETEQLLTPASWGLKLSFGHARLAAHFALDASGAAGSGSGQVTSRRIGEISESYAAGATTAYDAMLSSTKHGRIYLALRDSLSSVRSVPNQTGGWDFDDGSLL